MEIILSIVVPVYNVENYLRKCVDSLLCQDVNKEQYEIILVDDGSTDGSAVLCDSLAASNANIKVVHQDNQGLSAARNTGLDITCGKFILFVDSDDWIERNVLNGLIRKMEDYHLDVLRFKFRRIWDKETECKDIPPSDLFSDPGITTGIDFLTNMLGFNCYAWQFLIKRELLVQNNLLFKPGIIFEDTEWTPRVLESAKRVSDSCTLVYNYVQREGSITNSAAQKVVNGQMVLVDLIAKQMEDKADKRWYRGMIAQIIVSMITSISTDLYPQRRFYLTELMRKDIFPLSLFRASKSGRRKIKLINCSPRLTCFVIHIANR